jgi:peptidoglycan/LPS O-acetylase OafA/YrhL
MSANAAANAAPRRNQSLDLLRGIAILMVVAAHCGLSTTSFVPGLAATVGSYGQLGIHQRHRVQFRRPRRLEHCG